MVIFPADSDPKMTALARTRSNCKRQTHWMLHEGYDRKGSVKESVCESQGAWRQDELIGGKPPVVK
jgi:hypothetical protein